MKNIQNKVIICGLVICSLSIADVRNPSSPASRTQRYPNQEHSSQYENSQYRFNPNTGNDIMTGNVSGGRHFRGVVPYGSPYEFKGSQGSSTLNDFYRVSSGSDFENIGFDGAFNLPSKSVTAFRKDNDYTLEKPSASKGQMNIGKIDSQKAEIDKAALRPVLGDISPLRPLSSPLEAKAKGLELYLSEKSENKNINVEDKIENRLNQMPDKLAENPFDIEPLKTVKSEKNDENTAKLFEQEKQPDVYQQMLETLQRQFQEQLAAKHEENLKLAEEKRKEIEEKQKEELQRITQLLEEKRGSSNKSANSDQDNSINTDEQEKLPDSFKSFASGSISRFNQYMKAAEELMKAGQYYKAADAYALAAAYENRHPLAYAGQTHSLFAAGEYMSSSFYLSRTLKIFGYYALLKIEIKTMIGNDDVFNKRLQELVALEEKSGSPELETLLAYIYKNIGENQKAVDYIDLAKRKQPNDTAIDALQQAINNI